MQWCYLSSRQQGTLVFKESSPAPLSTLTAIHVELEPKTVIEVLISSLGSHPRPFAPIDQVEKDVSAVVSNISIVVAVVGNRILNLNRR